MASTTTVTASVTVNDTVKNTVVESNSVALAMAAGMVNGLRQTLALVAATFQALTVPTGAKGALLMCGGSTGTLTIKGVVGDTGIVVQSAVAGCPLLIPLGTTPSFGLLSTTTQTMEIIWF